jgi:death-on-curing protein
MTPRFLSMEAVKRMQSDSIDTYGGSHGLRDEGLLESALDRAQNRYLYEPESSIAELGAALSWGLIKNHVFIDGNKRVGLASLIVFLEVNGYELSASVLDTQEMTLKAAASECSEAEWTAWVVSQTRPVEGR